MEESRTKKASRNVIFSFAFKIVDVVLAFVLRTFFIRFLGVNYLGISGLFTNILTVLSLMELGVGSAIAFSLYRPLAEKDQSKITALMQLYRKVYTTIGVIVLVLGFSLTPFLKYIINLPEDIPDLNVIYWLSVSSTAISYFLAYRRTLLIADQRSDVCTKVDIIFRLIRCLALILVLIVTKNYIAYLATEVINTLICNIVITMIVKKRYPYIEKFEKIELEKSEKQNIIKYMASTLLAKFGQTVVTSTDSIIISAFISTSMVGYYSNYSLIYNNLDIIVYLLFSGITASVGNYAVTKSGEQSYRLFKKLSMANYIVVCLISVCFFCLASPFITIWLGEQFRLGELTVVIIALNFYITANQNCISNFMSAMGEMYYRNRYRALIEGVINLIASILLVKYTGLGISGVFLGTTICFVVGRMWMDARVLFIYWFKMSFNQYIKSYVTRFFVFVAISIVMKYITSRVFTLVGISVVTWLVCSILCVGTCLIAYKVIWGKTDEYAFLTDILYKIIKKMNIKRSFSKGE